MTISADRDNSYRSEVLPRITIILTKRCHHKCWYCCVKNCHKKKLESVVDVIGVDKYIDLILKISNGMKVEYRFGGGEPTIHPYFSEILNSILSHGHNASIMTNGQNANLVDNVAKNYSSQVYYEVSFHYGAYIRDKSDIRLNKYMNCFDTMLSHSNGMYIVVPMTPELLINDKTEFYLDILLSKSIGHNFIHSYNPMNMFTYGMYKKEIKFLLTEFYLNSEEKRYPMDYTENEKNRVVELMKKYQDPNFSISNLNQIIKFAKHGHLNLSGLDCYYMNRNLYVRPDGTIRYCNSGKPHKDKFHLLGKLPNLNNSYSKCSFKECTCLIHAFAGCLNPNSFKLKDFI